MAPTDKVIEARHQTTHKLEIMEHYWGAWCTILAQTAGRWPFCPTHLWLIDTHAGPGRHLSEGDPDGQVPGTPMFAAIAARAAQRRVSGVEIHVRTTDKNRKIASELDRRLRGLKGRPPDGVDVTVEPLDWVTVVPRIRAEIEREDHPHGGRRGAWRHDHRSLWFIDPFGIEGIDHAVIESFPRGSEVIINLDLMATVRHIGRSHGIGGGTIESEFLLDAVYGGNDWRGIEGGGPKQRETLAWAFAQSFSTDQWRIRWAYLLRPTGSQHRAMIHLTNSTTAQKAFARAVDAALARGTLIAGRKLSKTQRDREAMRLHALFRGLTLTTHEMRSMVPYWGLDQLRWICNTAELQGLGHLDGANSRMEWFNEREAPVAPLTLDL